MVVNYKATFLSVYTRVVSVAHHLSLLKIL